ncbi:nucleoside-diphosphate kinase [Wukongibacter baidiensis]|uniref:nucleoside-diphosphate kinase n=1 Tax=Wukongibacter baidiensis TaxID=1723361 RepID=UPI003D7F99F8
MERTLVLIKPDAVERNIIGKIIGIYEESGLYIENLKMISPTRRILEEHYEEHREKSFFEELIASLKDKNAVALIIKGDEAISRVRKINGATDPVKAEEGTIRKTYASSIRYNTVHGSSDPEAAEREIRIWFES